MNISKPTILVTSLFFLLLISCDKLFDENCIYKGYICASNEFYHPKDFSIPSQEDMQLYIFPLSGKGVDEYKGKVIPYNELGKAKGELHIGKYEFLTCNSNGNNITGTDKLENLELQLPVSDNLIQTEPLALYSSFSRGDIPIDDSLKIDFKSQIITQKIRFNVTLLQVPPSCKIEKIDAILDGIITSKKLYNREKGENSARLPFEITEKESDTKFSKEIYVLGVDSNVPNKMEMDLIGDLNMKTTVDLSDVFMGFASDLIIVDLSVKLEPYLGVASVKIVKWQIIDHGDIDITYN